MQRRYSRFESVEEKRSIRHALFFGILTVALIIFIMFMGLSLAGRFAAYINDLRGQKITTNSDNTPPGPPFINTLPSATNKNQLVVSGAVESNSDVIFTINSKQQDVKADGSGSFTITLDLDQGQNTISAVAKDAAGNTSKKTQDYIVTYSSQPPNLIISDPQDNQQFFGSKQKTIAINGKTDPGVDVTVNDRLVRLNDDGSFSFKFTLSDGNNSLSIKATDTAGNTTEKTLTVVYSS